MENILIDKELGTVKVRMNARARRLTFTTHQNEICVTVPLGTTAADIRKAIDDLRPKLIAARQKAEPRTRIDLNFSIDTEFFKLKLVAGRGEKFLASSELGHMRITCPPDANFDDENLQEWMRKVIEEALRRNAKIILPPSLYVLSKQYNLPYKSVKINSSKGRWGSCSSSRNINLSYFLVLLPQHLIDYVLLHELTHTIEMNHSERFWAHLDKLTKGKSKELREELKGYKTGF